MDITKKESIAPVIRDIKTVLETTRGHVALQVNSELLHAYWRIGQIIAEYEQTVPDRADYGKQTLKEVSRALTAEFGKGQRLFCIKYTVYAALLPNLSNSTDAVC